MSDVLIDDIDAGLADASASSDNEVSLSYDDLVVVVNDIKDILTDNFDTSDSTETLTEYSIDDVYTVLLDLKSIGSCILIIFVASVTISVFRKLFDVF